MAPGIKTSWSGWCCLFIYITWIANVSTLLQLGKPHSDYCKSVSAKPGVGSITSPSQTGENNERKRIKCYNPLLIQSIYDAQLSPILSSITQQLDLSGNSIAELTNSSFRYFTLLERLNLAENKINIINHGAFNGLGNLKHLNLSFNHLRAIDNTTFESLIKLEKLFLVGNYLSKLRDGTFDVLVSIKLIDLAVNPLICDCHLHWILGWTNKSVISSRTTCQYPPLLKSIRLPKVKPKQWRCDWPPPIPYFILQPSQSQIVFSGDSLQFQCHVSNVDSSIGLFWTFNNKELDQDRNTDEVSTQMQISADGMLLQGSLFLQNLTLLHTGTWTCWYRTLNGNETRSVFIRVLSEHTRFCSESITSGNKGNYLWPRTVAGVKVELPCSIPPSTVRRRDQNVSHTCSNHGSWEHLDTSKCPYVSEVTKILEQFTNLNLTSSSAIESVHRLKNYTDSIILSDKMDVVFISRTITKYLDFVSKHREIGDVVIDIIGIVMNLNVDLLRAAQLEDRACSKLIEAVEKLPELVAEVPASRYSPNIAVEELIVDAVDFRGVTCATFTRAANPQTQQGRSTFSSPKKYLRCLPNNLSHQADQDDTEMLEASIYLPASLFHTIEQKESSHLRLQISVYKNSLLFPQTRVDNYPGNLSVVSAVIGTKLAKHSVMNLTEPIFVTLRTPNAHGEIIPVWWNSSANDKLGEWSREGCQLKSVYGNLVSFQCDRLGNFGLLQDLEKFKSGNKGKVQRAEFRFHHPVLYVGSAICVHCLLATIVTYVLGFRLIHIPKKNKHSLINVCIAVNLLCLLFTLSIRHTEDEKICQGVGLILHYLTLVCLLWLVIIASNTYKKLNRSDHSDTYYSDEPPADYPIPPKPMLRFYLVGWGVPVIICGISAAVNLEDYAGPDYCFLAFNHSVGAFYGPCCVLLFLLCIFYLLIFCSIRKNAEMKREQGARESTEIELMETSNINRLTTNGCDNLNVRPNSENNSEEDDLEHPPSSQLRAQIVILLLFSLSWASAAISTAEPFSTNVSLAELLFGCAYAASVGSLGIFILVFHCATREDVRLVWKMLYHCRESGIVRETVPLPQSNAINSVEMADVRRSNDSMSSSYTSKSCSTNHSVDGAKARLPKISNVEAAIAMAGGVTDTSWSGEMFYNPYQNGVARKYFKKRAKQTKRSKNEYPALDEEQIVEVNPVKEVDKLLPVLVPSRIIDKQAVIQNTIRVVKRDPSTESQLYSSSSQGLVSMSPSLSTGNRSDRSLLIVEEEDEDEISEISQKTATSSPSNENMIDAVGDCDPADVDWGSTNVVSPNEMQFSPPSLMESFTPTPTEPQTKDISISCNLNDIVDGAAASLAVTDVQTGDDSKIGSEGDLRVPHSNELSAINGFDKLPQRGGTLPRSNWERQLELSRRSNQPIYAYVNHSHHQNLANVLEKSRSESQMARSASVGDGDMVALNNDSKHLISQPCLHLGNVIGLVLEQIGKKETSV